MDDLYRSHIRTKRTKTTTSKVNLDKCSRFADRTINSGLTMFGSRLDQQGNVGETVLMSFNGQLPPYGRSSIHPNKLQGDQGTFICSFEPLLRTIGIGSGRAESRVDFARRCQLSQETFNVVSHELGKLHI